MVSDSVDTRRAKTNATSEGDALEQVIQTWLNNNSGVTSLDEIKFAEEGQNYTIVTFIYTA